MKTERSAKIAYQCFGNIELVRDHNSNNSLIDPVGQAQRHHCSLRWAQSTVLWQRDGDLASSGEIDEEKAAR